MPLKSSFQRSECVHILLRYEISRRRVIDHVVGWKALLIVSGSKHMGIDRCLPWTCFTCRAYWSNAGLRHSYLTCLPLDCLLCTRICRRSRLSTMLFPCTGQPGSASSAGGSASAAGGSESPEASSRASKPSIAAIWRHLAKQRVTAAKVLGQNGSPINHSTCDESSKWKCQ